ncbi:hypothetical protein H4R33_003563 [Dimargaris cristalligena]|uniref:Cysteine-rich PDZ-binding protein n=1 Tax=Dimargaris cristalligena TaxID=215637 RepID=A0A4Q0A215_9FUNG|nr:hypothetical protein H4R33_003563 [Dimargaris cristalligena]RKP40135.1 cysteine-rich PDZ-binding protein-like protein [Dimargaris cristalligena]|eukprot:RKP40135.1 cysteine-rich PDZ-binding protein-like protein [Dimargaris cristalligena]
MVCQKCEKKLGKVACSDTWKAGSRNATVGKDRKLNENKLLAAKKNRFQPYSSKCKVCRSAVHQPQANWCQACAYKKGICAMCGVKILDTTMYKQSAK